MAGLRDPKARLSDKASALRIVVEAHALITGGPTSRTANVNVNVDGSEMDDAQREEIRRFLDAIDGSSDDELREWAASGGLAGLSPRAQLEAEAPDG